MEAIWTYLAICIALYYALTKTILKKHEKLPPSPFLSLPIIGHLHHFRGRIHRNLAQLSARHGPMLLLRLGQHRTILVSSYSAVEQFIGKNDALFASRTPTLSGEIFGYKYTTISFSPHGDHWRNLRLNFVNEVVSPHRLNLLAGHRADEVKLLLRRIYRQISSSESSEGSVHVRSLMLEAVNNVMTRMINGKRYYGECEETEEAKRFREIIPVFVAMFAESITVSDFVPALKWYTAGHEKKLRASMGEFDEFLQEMVDQERRRRKEEGCDRDGSDDSMMEVLLSMQRTDPEMYTDEVVKGVLLVLLTAGTDAEAVAVEWALSLLLRNPTTLAKAQKEIDEVVGHHRLMEESDLKNLVYLRCIIKETLRMYPPILFYTRNNSEECNITNVETGEYYQLPRNTTVLVNGWALQNDPKVWDEPRKFKPERFYEEIELNKKGYRLMSFGIGRRGCPGEVLGMKKVGLILGSVLQCYEWEISAAEEENDETVELKEAVGFSLYRANPLIAKCRPRRQHLIDLCLA